MVPRLLVLRDVRRDHAARTVRNTFFLLNRDVFPKWAGKPLAENICFVLEFRTTKAQQLTMELGHLERNTGLRKVPVGGGPQVKQHPKQNQPKQEQITEPQGPCTGSRVVL